MKKTLVLGILFVILSFVALGSNVTIQPKDITFADYAKLKQLTNSLVEIHVPKNTFSKDMVAKLWIEVYQNKNPNMITDGLFQVPLPVDNDTTILIFLEDVSEYLGKKEFELTIYSEDNGARFTKPIKLELDGINDPIISFSSIRRHSPTFELYKALPIFEIIGVREGGIIRGGLLPVAESVSLYDFYAVINVEFQDDYDITP